MMDNWNAVHGQIHRWIHAANALHNGDVTGIVTALSHYDGDGHGDEVIYQEVLTLAVLGAHLTAAQIIRVHGGEQSPPPPGRKYALYARVPDPSLELSANERVATHAVLAASKCDHSAVVDLVMGYAGAIHHPDGKGLQRLADLTLTLLRMYVEYSRMEATA